MRHPVVAAGTDHLVARQVVLPVVRLVVPPVALQGAVVEVVVEAQEGALAAAREFPAGIAHQEAQGPVEKVLRVDHLVVAGVVQAVGAPIVEVRVLRAVR